MCPSHSKHLTRGGTTVWGRFCRWDSRLVERRPRVSLTLLLAAGASIRFLAVTDDSRRGRSLAENP